VDSAQNGAETFLNSQNMKNRLIINKHLPTVWFSSREGQSIYEEEFKEFISSSTVSSTLSRTVDRGFLMKNRAAVAGTIG
jgi:hypothetical protein